MEFRGKTAAEAWEQSIETMLQLYDQGRIKPVLTEHDNYAIELTGVLLCVDNVTAKYQKSKHSQKSSADIDTYAKELLGKGREHHVYRRLTISDQEPFINQEAAIVERLKENSYSRRAIIDLWNMHEDLSSKYPPCVCTMQFMIRNQALQLHTFFRSNDAWELAHADMIAFIQYQKRIASRLGIKASTYSQYVGSYHIYDSDIPIARVSFSNRRNGSHD